MKVKVLRAFFYEKKVHAVGKTLDVADGFAREQLAIGRVEIVDDKPTAARGPMKSADSALVAGGALVGVTALVHAHDA